MKQKVLLLTPPLIQLNTPYPATMYLAGFLKTQGIECEQRDAAIDLVLQLFSKDGLQQIREHILLSKKKKHHPSVEFFLRHSENYILTIDTAIRFLQGSEPTTALRINSRKFLPEGPRFSPLNNYESLEWAFGALGEQDQAKHLASLFIDDLSDVITHGVSPYFELSRYAEKIASSTAQFDPLLAALRSSANLIDQYLEEITLQYIQDTAPSVIAISLPFPGNVYGGLRMAQAIKKKHPQLPILLGGGYVNTELRELSDTRIFDFVDFITLDDGEKPILCILELLQKKRKPKDLLRTFVRENNKVVFYSSADEKDIAHKDVGAPTYQGLTLNRYISMLEMLNPMHRLWSDGTWLKLTLAHGCYWHKCTFCDTSLDYIKRYDFAKADILVDRIEALIKETGHTGFHFVDEAAPPAIIKALCQRLIERQVQITWWGNIRFEKQFDATLAELMSQAGCVAVSGGLEVASNRLLEKINKGVSVEQVARVARDLTEAGIMVHAYLMYGFPTQTTQETVDSLERVRQLFEQGCIQSAYWHRFAATIHSPIGQNPDDYGIKLLKQPKGDFGNLDVAFTDLVKTPHEQLGVGLRKALYNYMHGIGLDEDVRAWFDIEVPKTKVARNFITKALSET